MWLSRAALARPRLVLGVWGVLIAVLAFRGLGVEDRLHRGAITVPGAAATANKVSQQRFGAGAPISILLEGPRAPLDREGRRLVARIERLPHVRVLSPWTAVAGGEGPTLRPRSDRALILVRQNAPFEQQSRVTVPRLRRLLTGLGRPVRAHMTGAPDVANGIQEASLSALRRAELLAAPLLLIVLLLVFRSPIAAAVPLLLGLTTVGAARGVIDLINRVIALDSLALSIASTLGLALGVDYSLLVVSRFREERARGADVRDAVVVAAQRAGHTVLMAGAALLTAVAISLVAAPGGLLASATSGALVAAVLTVLGATTALPALLLLIGPHVDRWRLGGQSTSPGRATALALAALRRPRVAALAVGGLLLALAAPALNLRTGPPDVRGLPSASVEHRDYDAIRRALGAGWMAPFDVVVTADAGAITAPARLRALDRFQAQIARLPGVDTVFGPAQLTPAVRRLDAIPHRLQSAQRALTRGQRDQRRLAMGIGRVRRGIHQVRTGLGEAAGGAAALDTGGARASAGARQLAAGLDRARAGAQTIVTELGRAGAGAGALARGVGAARRGVRQLADGVTALRRSAAGATPGVTALLAGLRAGRDDVQRLRQPAQTADGQLRAALDALDELSPAARAEPAAQRATAAVTSALAAVSGRDPRTGQPITAGYDGIDSGLGRAVDGLGGAITTAEQLQAGVGQLDKGLAALDGGVTRLRGGIDRLDTGARALRTGLRRLGAGGAALRTGLADLRRGATSLDGGAAQLAAGAGRLARSLDGGATRSGELDTGVARVAAAVKTARARTDRLGAGLGDARQLVRISRSGHLLLAAVDSAPANQRTAAGLIVNVDRGGSAADITVIARRDPSRAGEPVRGALERAAGDFTKRTGMRALVGGSAPVFQDFDRVSAERLPLLIAGLVLLTYLALVAIFRSLVLPAIAVLLNAATVLAAFGVLAVTFQGEHPLLGGPGFLDAISMFGALSIVFGLSIDYAVFVISRMREGYAATGSVEGAVEEAITGTARIVTGAAMIMSGVFLALAVADVSNLRQLGVGLTVAVLLDATLVRLVLLPALVTLAGPAAWWLPRWLDRLLPGGAAARDRACRRRPARPARAGSRRRAAPAAAGSPAPPPDRGW